ncbi:hypothetical protein A2U01_0068751, partial [Trifolium medium]|nr:hypothetical protein [Trifolium medium]
MLIGVDAPILGSLPLAIVCFLEKTYSRGYPRGNPPYLAPVLKPNTVELP